MGNRAPNCCAIPSRLGLFAEFGGFRCSAGGRPPRFDRRGRGVQKAERGPAEGARNGFVCVNRRLIAARSVRCWVCLLNLADFAVLPAAGRGLGLSCRRAGRLDSIDAAKMFRKQERVPAGRAFGFVCSSRRFLLSRRSLTLLELRPSSDRPCLVSARCISNFVQPFHDDKPCQVPCRSDVRKY